jgi:hypothetical protein
MVAQIIRALGPAVVVGVRGTAGDYEGKRFRYPRSDDVCGDELAQPYSGVESFGRGVDQLPASHSRQTPP